MTQNNLGNALQALETRSAGEEGGKLLEDAVAAYRSALEACTKADLPQDRAMTQINLISHVTGWRLCSAILPST